MESQQDTQRAFRNALGSFATGVTIATTTNGAGEPVGVTASSFNSVSVDPPLILWSLAKGSHSQPAFCDSGHFAVHVLAASQEELSNRFARGGGEKFKDVAWSAGQLGSPILDNFAGLFQCRTRYQYEGGDHVILVGEVIDFESRDVAPLLFHGGSYAEKRARPRNGNQETIDIEHGRFTDDFLFYLIARAYFQTSYPTRERLAAHASSMEEHMTLALLSLEAPLSGQEIAARLAHTGHAPTDALLDQMVANGLLRVRSGGYEHAEKGQELYVDVLVHLKSFESDLVAHFTPAELADTKRVLRKIIELSKGDIPFIWPRG